MIKISPYVFPGVKMEAFKYDDVSDLDITTKVCDLLSLNRLEVLGKARDQRYVQGRYIIWLLLRFGKHYTYAEIAKMFGRDHTTVVHGISIGSHHIKHYEQFSNEFRQCFKKIFPIHSIELFLENIEKYNSIKVDKSKYTTLKNLKAA